MKVRNWRQKCKDRRLWKEIVKQAKTHRGLYRRLKKKKITIFKLKKLRPLFLTENQFRTIFEFNSSSILLLVANGHYNCIKRIKADVWLRTPDD